MTDPREEHAYMRSQKNGADKDYNLHLEPDGQGQCLPLEVIALGAQYEPEQDDDSEEEALGMAPGC